MFGEGGWVMVRGGGTYCLEACPEPAIGRGDGVWEAVETGLGWYCVNGDGDWFCVVV